MRLRNRFDGTSSRRRGSLRKVRASLEIFEPRQLLSNNLGFVQGFALTSLGAPVVGATVQLLTTSNKPLTPPATTTTNSSGYYGFNGVTPGTYNVMEVASGYTTSVNGSDIQTTVNPASAINSGTEIQVTVKDPTTQNLGLQWTGGITGDSVNETLIASSYNQAGFSGVSQEGQLQVQFVSPPGNPNLGNVGAAPNTFFSFCSDLLHVVHPGVPYTVQPSLTPNTTTLYMLPDYPYSVNLGEIGYLYKTFGTTAQTSVNASALQLALWALEYNQMPSSGAMTLGNPNTPFIVTTTGSSPTPAAIVSAADTFLSEAYTAETSGNSQNAYFLNLNTAAEETSGANSGQGMFCTDLLNFTNSPTPTSAFDLAFTKTDGTTTYTPGGSTTYTIVEQEAGQGAGSGSRKRDRSAIGNMGKQKNSPDLAIADLSRFHRPAGKSKGSFEFGQ